MVKSKLAKNLFFLFNCLSCLLILPIPFWIGRFYERKKIKHRFNNYRAKGYIEGTTTKRVQPN